MKRKTKEKGKDWMDNMGLGGSLQIHTDIKHNGAVFSLFWGVVFFEIVWEGWK